MTTTFIESDCTIEHEGRTFTAAGASVTDDYAVVYIGSDSGTSALGTINRIGAGGHHVTDWHGNIIGKAHQTGTWTVRGTRVFSYYVTIFGAGYAPCGRGACTARHYNMRGQGVGMVARGRRSLA